VSARDDVLRAVPGPTDEPLRTWLIWKRIGQWSRVTIKQNLEHLAAEGVLEAIPGNFNNNPATLYRRRA
jgi:hypothetical protein